MGNKLAVKRPETILALTQGVLPGMFATLTCAWSHGRHCQSNAAFLAIEVSTDMVLEFFSTQCSEPASWWEWVDRMQSTFHIAVPTNMVALESLCLFLGLASLLCHVGDGGEIAWGLRYWASYAIQIVCFQAWCSPWFLVTEQGIQWTKEYDPTHRL